MLVDHTSHTRSKLARPQFTFETHCDSVHYGQITEQFTPYLSHQQALVRGFLIRRRFQHSMLQDLNQIFSACGPEQAFPKESLTTCMYNLVQNKIVLFYLEFFYQIFFYYC